MASSNTQSYRSVTVGWTPSVALEGRVMNVLSANEVMSVGWLCISFSSVFWITDGLWKEVCWSVDFLHMVV